MTCIKRAGKGFLVMKKHLWGLFALCSVSSLGASDSKSTYAWKRWKHEIPGLISHSFKGPKLVGVLLSPIESNFIDKHKFLQALQNPEEGAPQKNFALHHHSVSVSLSNSSGDEIASLLCERSPRSAEFNGVNSALCMVLILPRSDEATDAPLFPGVIKIGSGYEATIGPNEGGELLLKFIKSFDEKVISLENAKNATTATTNGDASYIDTLKHRIVRPQGKDKGGGWFSFVTENQLAIITCHDTSKECKIRIK